MRSRMRSLTTHDTTGHSDTTDAARRVQRRVLSGMSPEKRVLVAAQMSEDARAVAAAGIRALHRAWPDAQVRRSLLVRIYGADLVERAWGASRRS